MKKMPRSTIILSIVLIVLAIGFVAKYVTTVNYYESVLGSCEDAINQLGKEAQEYVDYRDTKDERLISDIKELHLSLAEKDPYQLAMDLYSFDRIMGTNLLTKYVTVEEVTANNRTIYDDSVAAALMGMKLSEDGQMRTDALEDLKVQIDSEPYFYIILPRSVDSERMLGFLELQEMELERLSFQENN